MNSKYFNSNSDNFCSLNFSPLFHQMREEIYEQQVKLDNWSSLWNIQDISIKVPKPRYPSHANSRDKDLNSSTQAKPEEQLEEQHRQGAGVQPYPVIT